MLLRRWQLYDLGFFFLARAQMSSSLEYTAPWKRRGQRSVDEIPNETCMVALIAAPLTQTCWFTLCTSIERLLVMNHRRVPHTLDSNHKWRQRGESGSSCLRPFCCSLVVRTFCVLLHTPFFHVQAVTYPRGVHQHRNPLNYFTTFIVGSAAYSSGGSHFNIRAAWSSPTNANRVM